MKKPAKEFPYVGTCRFCGNGLLRLWVNATEKKAVAVCDECELLWDDPVAASGKAKLKASGNFSSISSEKTRGKIAWRKATAKDVAALGLEEQVKGYCE